MKHFSGAAALFIPNFQLLINQNYFSIAVTPERLISRILKFEMTSRKASMRLGTSDSSMTVSYTHLTLPTTERV